MSGEKRKKQTFLWQVWRNYTLHSLPSHSSSLAKLLFPQRTKLPFCAKWNSSKNLILFLIDNVGRVRFYVSISSVASFNSSIWYISYKPIFSMECGHGWIKFQLEVQFYLHNQCTEIMWRKFLENTYHFFYVWH